MAAHTELISTSSSLQEFHDKQDSRNTSDSDEFDHEPRKRKRFNLLLHSDSDTDKENIVNNPNYSEANLSESGSDHDSSKVSTSRIRKLKKRELNETSSSENETTITKEEQQNRLKTKRNKLRDKFKDLVTSRSRDTELNNSAVEKNSDSSDQNDGEASIENIKEKIKSRMLFKPSICDPDTSEEEDNSKSIPVSKPKKERKSAIEISPKPLRMSAKQAMENMQKIKSESNRMLREKGVSLPYHRPKALTLKDIMDRRKPALSLDGKALPLKMNEEQLRQYALQLEQRQKEMIELCKSESDSEENDVEDEGNQENTVENKVISRTLQMSTSNKEEQYECQSKQANDEQKENFVDKPNDVMLNKNVNDYNVTMNTENVTTVENTQQIATEEQASESSIKLIYDETLNEYNTVLENSETIPAIGHDETNLNKELISSNITSNDIDIKERNLKIHDNKSELQNSDNRAEEMEHINTDQNIMKESIEKNNEFEDNHNLSDDDINMEDIDKIIENAEIFSGTADGQYRSPMLIKNQPVNSNPKLTGAPGMVIDLDDIDPIGPKKLSGIELLKERFTYFAKLKTPEEMERAKEKTLIPGTQHLKLKQKLEDKIAEQRSLEWAKRLEEEKQQQLKMKAGEDSDAEDELDKIEAKLAESIEVTVEKKTESDDESENDEDLVENDCDMTDKPRAKNSMLDDEAEESECDENADENNEVGSDDNDSSDNESEESEEEESNTVKKGRILKAFEDSDDETETEKNLEKPVEIVPFATQLSQDDELQLAQRDKCASVDLFTSQGSALVSSGAQNKADAESLSEDKVLGTQTFSILGSSKLSSINVDLNASQNTSESQNYQQFDDMYDAPGSLTQKFLPSQLDCTQSATQPLGEDILALCTGKFYDNEFVSQVDDNADDYVSQDSQPVTNSLNNETPVENENYANEKAVVSSENNNKIMQVNENIPDKVSNTDTSNKETKADGNLLKSILDELDDPEFEEPKPNKYFVGNTQINTDLVKGKAVENSLMRKKLVIESDDETNEGDQSENKKVKRLKKKRPEKRALQISDDEDELSELEEMEEDEDVLSDVENEADERVVEYDSEENEVDVTVTANPKKKKKASAFFEDEAEMTSEDEWVGSGDEDERGLDRMEREAGDDDTFHQGALQRELGQIHMRDVLDQDKREVRLIQELLFEDGDLGDGGRQRKFRWNNADEEGAGTIPNEFADTQDEEFESEEQWRKQRHEREVFLRQMKEKDAGEESPNISINRNAIIKANLSSVPMSSFSTEVNSKTDNIEIAVAKKTAKDIPSPKKSFAIFQQSYHGSLLSRGRGALARLAALATPLAADADGAAGAAPTSRRNFVFATLTPKRDEPKVTKRKADANVDTPKLVKKMKREEKNNKSKLSLLDHLKT